MKKFYNSRLLRERVLMLVFLGIGFLWWGPTQIGRVRENMQTWRTVSQDRELQELWLAKAASVDERTKLVAKQLDPTRTMNATQAYAEVSRLANGLPVEIAVQRPERTENFALHTLQATFRRTDMAGLVRFYEGVVARSPYLGIDQCTISADRATPGMLNAVFRIYSVEPIAAAH